MALPYTPLLRTLTAIVFVHAGAKCGRFLRIVLQVGSISHYQESLASVQHVRPNDDCQSATACERIITDSSWGHIKTTCIACLEHAARAMRSAHSFTCATTLSRSWTLDSKAQSCGGTVSRRSIMPRHNRGSQILADKAGK